MGYDYQWTRWAKLYIILPLRSLVLIGKIDNYWWCSFQPKEIFFLFCWWSQSRLVHKANSIINGISSIPKKKAQMSIKCKIELQVYYLLLLLSMLLQLKSRVLIPRNTHSSKTWSFPKLLSIGAIQTKTYINANHEL